MASWPVTISQSVTPSEYRSERMSTPTPANCSGLANSGVPTKPLALKSRFEKPVQLTALARPRSMIFAVTAPPSSNLTMMLLGLMSR